MPFFVRFLIALSLLAAAAFCVFGFMATFEPPGHLVWRSVYGAGCLIFIVMAVWLLVRRGNSTSAR